MFAPTPPPKRKQTQRLRVTIDGRDVIERKHGIDTFLDVIKEVGIKDVKDLEMTANSIDFISTSEDPKREQRPLGEYYIVSGLSTVQKKEILDEIARRLEVDLKVELVDKV